ncbi:hypothetical protein ASPSYDRAFT_1165522 [Aspergillus sydowii CBS 593.65]|uniref:Uncharacterized protein n=1 Tax=Aspergillus sydowii CBS 593.65 TaxID=1036612 RepID=A0A1L9T0I7_9EURO|nr:uncharacterized protein ASPSYDRAFT_1165522 [Aspergillus sydowii CBS 593.65]OJJ52974.1 hypothetical protein ASPSYDRAFT_1165522 [Aspergillus sydowii CBS 593.65]
MPEYIVETVEEGVELLGPEAPQNEERLRQCAELMGKYTVGPIKGPNGKYCMDFGHVYAVTFFSKFVMVLADEGAEGFRQATLKDILQMSLRYKEDAPDPQPGDYAYGFHCLNFGDPLMVGTGRVLEQSVRHNVAIGLVASEMDGAVIGGLADECSQAWEEILAEESQYLKEGERSTLIGLGGLIRLICLIIRWIFGWS